MARERLTSRALNRALLARQGLLSRNELPLVELVESICALQAQYWPAVPVALWSRMRDLEAEDLYRALQERQLVVGTLLRRTLHVTSARQHPYYAMVAEASGATDWRRTAAEAPAEMEKLRAELLTYAETVPRSGEELAAFIEAWVAQHEPDLDEAELEHQRRYRWRSFLTSSSFVRASADAGWGGGRVPAAYIAAPRLPSGSLFPSREKALDSVIRSHLGAFGPAAPEDVASWIGWRTPLVRAAVDRLGPEVVRFEDEAGRVLYDLAEAPRPDPDIQAPVRLLPWFDSVLLAYASRHRGRILPDPHRELVYVRANLQVLATFLVDGLVAGTWSVEARRRQATLSLRPFGRLARAVRAALLEEAERLLHFLYPTAAHKVVFDQ